MYETESGKIQERRAGRAVVRPAKLFRNGSIFAASVSGCYMPFVSGGRKQKMGLIE